LNNIRLPAGWKLSKLKDLLSEPLINGRSVPTREDGFPVLRLTSIKPRLIDLTEHKNGNWTEDQAKPFLVAEGDFLVSRGNGSIDLVGRGAKVPKAPIRVAFPDTMIRIRIRPDEISSEYLAHIWESLIVRDQIKKSVRTTAGIYKVNQRALGEIRLPVPPLHEQRRIVEVLDSVDAMRAKRRRAIALLGDLAQSIFLDMFSDGAPGWATWPVHELRTMCSMITKGTTPTSVGLSFATEGIPFLRVQNLRDGTIVFDDGDLYIDHESHRILKRSRIAPGDILVSIAGTVGRSAIVPSSTKELNCNQAVAIIRLLEPSGRRYVREWLVSNDAMRQIASSSVTATISNLSLGQLGSLKLRVPPIELQEEFARKLDTIDSLKESYRSSLTELDSLWASLQYCAFRGELAA
jgi:type I restriction enzyme S subunit